MAAIGARIRDERRAQRLSLEDLAARSEVSRSMLSAIELGAKVPTVLVIDRIAGALGVSVSRLLAPEESAESVVLLRRDDQQVVVEPGGWERRIVSPVVHGVEFELGRLEFEPHADAGEFSPHQEGWTEYVAVEKGRLEIVLDRSRTYVLGPGDALYYKSDVVHAFRNVGRATAVAYIGMLGRCEAVN